MPDEPTPPPLYDWIDPLDRPAHPLIRAGEAHLDAGRLSHAPRRRHPRLPLTGTPRQCDPGVTFAPAALPLHDKKRRTQAQFSCLTDPPFPPQPSFDTPRPSCYQHCHYQQPEQ